jgi:hypothetical protein
VSLLIKIVVAVLVGILIGLAFTIRSLDRDDQTMIGAWRVAPRDSNGEIDPYALAANARGHLLPLGAAEGLSFTAKTDSAGIPLRSRCDVIVTGPMPSARYWTVSLLDTSGFPVANAADRYGFTSAEVLRIVNQPVTITVAREARSGNWLPTGDADRFVLLLRLYDTGLSTVGANLESVPMPTIKTLGCR